MNTKAANTYATLRVEPAARDTASRLAYALTGAASQRITQSEAIRIGCQVALNHLAECTVLITAAQPDESAAAPSPGEDEGEKR